MTKVVVIDLQGVLDSRRRTDSGGDQGVSGRERDGRGQQDTRTIPAGELLWIYYEVNKQ